MALITPKPKSKKIQVRVSVKSDTLEQVRKYCEWIGILKVEEFFESAVEHVLENDKAWIKYLNDNP